MPADLNAAVDRFARVRNAGALAPSVAADRFALVPTVVAAVRIAAVVRYAAQARNVVVAHTASSVQSVEVDRGALVVHNAVPVQIVAAAAHTDAPEVRYEVLLPAREAAAFQSDLSDPVLRAVQGAQRAQAARLLRSDPIRWFCRGDWVSPFQLEKVWRGKLLEALVGEQAH